MKAVRAFSLVEVMLSVTLLSVVVVVVSSFVVIVLDNRVKHQVVSEVEQVGLQLVSFISQEIRNAEAITSPSPGNSAASLTLDVVEGAHDPTVFDLSSGVVQVTLGAGSAESLTSGRVVASALQFENLTRADTPGTIQFAFTLSSSNPGSRQAFEYSRTFSASASLR